MRVLFCQFRVPAVLVYLVAVLAGCAANRPEEYILGSSPLPQFYLNGISDDAGIQPAQSLILRPTEAGFLLGRLHHFEGPTTVQYYLGSEVIQSGTYFISGEFENPADPGSPYVGTIELTPAAQQFLLRSPVTNSGFKAGEIYTIKLSIYRSEQDITPLEVFEQRFVSHLDRNGNVLSIRARFDLEDPGQCIGKAKYTPMNFDEYPRILFPDNAEAANHWNEAVGLYHKKRFGEALLELDKSLFLMSSNDAAELHAQVQYHRGLTLAALQRYHDALTSFQQSLACNQEAGTRFGQAVNHFNLAMIHSHFGNSDKMKDSLEEALQIAKEIKNSDLIRKIEKFQTQITQKDNR